MNSGSITFAIEEQTLHLMHGLVEKEGSPKIPYDVNAIPFIGICMVPLASDRIACMPTMFGGIFNPINGIRREIASYLKG